MSHFPDFLKLALIGQNIQQSKSPFIHPKFGEAIGLTVTYVLKEVSDVDLFPGALKELQREGFHGCNITAPFKELAIKLSDAATERAKAAGSANTLRFGPDGQIFADNTDGAGAIRDITTNIGYALAGKRILVLGAGGAVRGVLGPLIEQHPARITIANRTTPKAIALAEHASKETDVPVVGCGYADLNEQYFDVIIDGTSQRGEPLPLPDRLVLAPRGLAYDMKYNSKGLTELLKWAEKRGIHNRHDGIGMLVEQAADGFAFWTHTKRPLTNLMLRALKADYPLARL